MNLLIPTRTHGTATFVEPAMRRMINYTRTHKDLMVKHFSFISLFKDKLKTKLKDKLRRNNLCL